MQGADLAGTEFWAARQIAGVPGGEVWVFGGEYKGDYGLVPAAMMADYLCGRPADLTDRRRVDPHRCRRLAFRQWVGRGIANRRQLDLTRPPR